MFTVVEERNLLEIGRTSTVDDQVVQQLGGTTERRGPHGNQPA
jgi:hypothetical protein